MKFLTAKLKAIGIHIPKLKEITGFRFASLINYRVDKSFHIENSIVVVDPSRLKGKQRRELAQLLRNELLAESGAIVDDTSSDTVDEAVEYLPSIEAVSKKFAELIPPMDISCLNACLFLRMRFNQGESVEDLKGQIIRSYGPKGRNLANLTTAGYLESVFLPLYAELLRAYPDNPVLVKAKFVEFYNTILTDLPWTEFISGPTSVAVATARIIDKMQRNLQNGVRYLNIHALGKSNVQKVLLIVPEVRNVVKAEITRLEQGTDRIFVRLEIPPLPLGAGQT